MPFIKSVKPFEDYRLLIELENGHAIILDMEAKLNTFRFNMLENKDIFRRVYTDGCSILWRKGVIRMSFGEILQMLKEIEALSLVG